MSPRIYPLEVRFERRTIPEPMSGCLLWTGEVNDKGYGRFLIGGKRIPSTHVALALAGRPVPNGMLACHHCDNPGCVNEAHLFVGTHTDNKRDMMGKNRHDHSGLLTGGKRGRRITRRA